MIRCNLCAAKLPDYPECCFTVSYDNALDDIGEGYYCRDCGLKLHLDDHIPNMPDECE